MKEILLSDLSALPQPVHLEARGEITIIRGSK